MSSVHRAEMVDRLGGVVAAQYAQRDWSPFVAHFTSHEAMKPVMKTLVDGGVPKQVAEALRKADEDSMTVVERIRADGRLRISASSLDNVPDRLSLSECSLPGLLGLCERYGRFGFVFRKKQVLAVDGAPCLHVSRAHYQYLATADADPRAREILGLANVYDPGHIDYSHEREWRVFDDLCLSEVPPSFIICPAAFISRVRYGFGPDRCYLPIDELYAWGV